MAPKAQKEPHGLGGQQVLGYLFFYCSLESNSSFKSTQILVKLAPRCLGLDS